ncbi:MAG TPA: hypothetical protein VFV65_08395, partial [Gemmatimonadales bacterium]|nr:hypothetical protein [Gemmatimonadales bacterium]
MVLPETIRDSRRLTGPNLVTDRAGAVLEVELSADSADALVTRWSEACRAALDAVGWSSEALAVRRYPGGASLAMTAPIDALYAATEVNEWAWTEASARAHGDEVDAEAAYARLRDQIEAERRPEFRAMAEAAAEHRVRLLWDDDQVS